MCRDTLTAWARSRATTDEQPGSSDDSSSFRESRPGGATPDVHESSTDVEFACLRSGMSRYAAVCNFAPICTVIWRNSRDPARDDNE